MALATILASFLYDNPLFILAFLMWIVSGLSSSYVLLKLVRAGYGGDALGIGKLIATLPHGYLRARTAHGWPAWPAHIIWISAISGIVAFAAGVIRFLP
jgi:hypothetical protein